jgi:hypothetical protein
MTFTEANTVEQMILDAVTGRHPDTRPVTGGKKAAVGLGEDLPGWGASLGGEFRPAHWDYIPADQIPRKPGDVMVESWVREALIRINPDIAAQPDRAIATSG